MILGQPFPQHDGLPKATVVVRLRTALKNNPKELNRWQGVSSTLFRHSNSCNGNFDVFQRTHHSVRILLWLELPLVEWLLQLFLHCWYSCSYYATAIPVSQSAIIKRSNRKKYFNIFDILLFLCPKTSAFYF